MTETPNHKVSNDCQFSHNCHWKPILIPPKERREWKANKESQKRFFLWETLCSCILKICLHQGVSLCSSWAQRLIFKWFLLLVMDSLWYSAYKSITQQRQNTEINVQTSIVPSSSSIPQGTEEHWKICKLALISPLYWVVFKKSHCVPASSSIYRKTCEL